MDYRPTKNSKALKFRVFAPDENVTIMADRYRNGGMGYGEAKNELFDLIWNYFAPYRERHAELMDDQQKVRRILLEGAEKARYHAIKTMRKVRKKVGSTYFKDK